MLRLLEGGTRALCPQVWPVHTQPGSMQRFGICERTWFIFSANLSGAVLTPYAAFLGTVIETFVGTRRKYVKANSASHVSHQADHFQVLINHLCFFC